MDVTEADAVTDPTYPPQTLKKTHEIPHLSWSDYRIITPDLTT
jgi:hypothetical protein